MPKQKHWSLANYIKAVDILAERKGFVIKSFLNKHNGIHFDAFRKGESEVWDVWTIHTEHTKKREIWSKEDYRKPDRCLDARAGEFLEVLESL